MSNEFNLERAKAGDSVEIMLDPEWVPVHFVGTDTNGHPVVQRVGDGPVFSVSSLRLRMAPKKAKVRYRVALIDAFIAGPRVIAANTDHEAAQCATRGDFTAWLTDWIETEITE